MPLHSLKTYQFRNLQDIQLHLDTGLQIIYGDNASGKTSILEAIHVLCGGKSFLGASPRKLQQFNTTDFSLHGEISQTDNLPQQLQYCWKDASIQLNIGHQQIRRTSEYAALQPIQAITPLSYKLIDDSPDIRRRFMDWGVFHVKHDYIEVWRRFQRSLSQRNAMLIKGADKRTIAAWSLEYVQLAESLDQYRAAYVNELKSVVQTTFSRFLPDSTLSMTYQRGWDNSAELTAILEEHFKQDRERHFTYYGPQRAELSIRLDNKLAKDVASRGQKKLITFALLLSQARYQQSQGQHSGLLLVDDLPSELDAEHQGLVFEILRELPMQVVLSCIDFQQLEIAREMAKKVFHVKQGKVQEEMM